MVIPSGHNLGSSAEASAARITEETSAATANAPTEIILNSCSIGSIPLWQQGNTHFRSLSMEGTPPPKKL
jgi:hypothetical protein